MKLQIIAGSPPCPQCGYPLNDGPGGCTACGKFCTLGWTCGGYAHGTIPIGNGQVCEACYHAMQDETPTYPQKNDPQNPAGIAPDAGTNQPHEGQREK